MTEGDRRDHEHEWMPEGPWVDRCACGARAAVSLDRHGHSFALPAEEARSRG